VVLGRQVDGLFEIRGLAVSHVELRRRLRTATRSRPLRPCLALGARKGQAIRSRER
jgi:hypothetical protein